MGQDHTRTYSRKTEGEKQTIYHFVQITHMYRQKQAQNMDELRFGRFRVPI